MVLARTSVLFSSVQFSSLQLGRKFPETYGNSRTFPDIPGTSGKFPEL